MTQLQPIQSTLDLNFAERVGIHVNQRCEILVREGRRAAFVSGLPFCIWDTGDYIAENLFIVQARELCIASLEELALALGRSKRTLCHLWGRYRDSGITALVVETRGRPKGSGIDKTRDVAILRLHAMGHLNSRIAKQLGISFVTVSRALVRAGLTPNGRSGSQTELPLEHAKNAVIGEETSVEEFRTESMSQVVGGQRAEVPSEVPVDRVVSTPIVADEQRADGSLEVPVDTGASAPMVADEQRTEVPSEVPVDRVVSAPIVVDEQRADGSLEVPVDTGASASPVDDERRAEGLSDVPVDTETSASPVAVGPKTADVPEVEPQALHAPQNTPTNHAIVENPSSAGRSWDTDPFDRVMDRLRASRGGLLDVVPMFAPGQNLPYLGLLLAVPNLVQSGVMEEALRLYGSLETGFYGLRTVLTLMVLLSLACVKRPENLKEYAPSELGRVVGLDRIPEVKTLRRKLEELAKGPVEEYLLALARRRFLARDQALGWLYVDGHVRVYHGKEKIPATHVTRMRISMPAAQDIWIHDGDCNPVLAITLEAHPSLANVILPILEAAQELTGKRRLTMVFDRGGWSPTLFALLAEREVDFLTYRKGKYEAVPVDAFKLIPAPTGGPDWLLHDSEVELKSGMTVRQITRLKGTHQTPIITTRRDLPAEVLAARMFGRWAR
jgi:transposase